MDELRPLSNIQVILPMFYFCIGFCVYKLKEKLYNITIKNEKRLQNESKKYCN